MPQLLLPIDSANLFKLNLAMHGGAKQYTHSVRSGDALIKIANDYDTTVAALKEVNGLQSDQIRIGQKLIIPAPNTAATKASSSLVLSRNANIPVFSTKKHRVDHIIANGDSLWSIAKTYQVSTHELAEWNNMAQNETLRLGRKLTIYTKQSSNLAANSITYQIKAGDSLTAIAYRYKVTVNEITKWNNLDKDSLLRLGQPLTLYVDKA